MGFMRCIGGPKLSVVFLGHCMLQGEAYQERLILVKNQRSQKDLIALKSSQIKIKGFQKSCLPGALCHHQLFHNLVLPFYVSIFPPALYKRLTHVVEHQHPQTAKDNKQ